MVETKACTLTSPVCESLRTPHRSAHTCHRAPSPPTPPATRALLQHLLPALLLGSKAGDGPHLDLDAVVELLPPHVPHPLVGRGDGPVLGGGGRVGIGGSIHNTHTSRAQTGSHPRTLRHRTQNAATRNTKRQDTEHKTPAHRTRNTKHCSTEHGTQNTVTRNTIHWDMGHGTRDRQRRDTKHKTPQHGTQNTTPTKNSLLCSPCLLLPNRD